MARSRNIKPSFFLNEILGTLDPIISLLFAGLWCLADREGRLEDRPARIKAALFPYRENLDINGYLTVLSDKGFILRYQVDGQKLILVLNFKKHQAPHHTERGSALPPPSVDSINGCALTVKLQEQDGGNPPDSLIPDSLIPDSLIPSTPVGVAPSPSAPATDPPPGGKKKKRRTRDPLPLGRVGGLALEAFEETVACWPVEITGFNDRIRSNETRKIAVGNIPQAQRNFLQLIEEGHATAQELYACAWVASNQWKRQGYLWVPHLSTFYGPEKETWVQFLPEARKVLAEQEAQVAQEEMNHAI